ncbi:hypothetical protein D3C81_1991670 [compost metagenome]
MLQHLGQGLLEIGLAGDIELDRQGAAALPWLPVQQVFGAGLGKCQVSVRDHHVKACGKQLRAEALAQALAGAGYQCNLVHGRFLTGCNRYRRGYRHC